MSTTLPLKRYLTMVWVVSCLFALPALLLLPSRLRADDDDEFVPAQVVVKLDLAAGVSIDVINAAYGTTTLDTFLASAGIYLLQVAPGQDVESTVDLMQDDPRLIYVEPNFISEMPEGDPSETWAWGGYDPQPYLGQYASEMLNLAEAHVVTLGAGVKVAVLDTGAQFGHPRLAARLTTDGYDFVEDDALPADTFNGADDDGDGLIDEGAGHGTHVAGIINLVAPAADIMPLRVLDSDGRGNYYVIAEAIQYAAANGADVINLSLGAAASSALMVDILNVTAEAGVVVVAASGNLNSSSQQYPAAHDHVLAVTAIGPTFARSYFANYGPWINIAAPGESITSTFPIDGYAQWSGTSMATPFVAGQTALLRAVFPSAAPPNIASMIATTAHPIDDYNPGYEGLLGAGISDIGASVNYAPIAELTALNNGPTHLGETTRLTATVVAGSHVSYTWALGDGAVSQGGAIEHIYPAAGVFTAVVTASNALGVLTTTTSVVITPPDIVYVSGTSNGSAGSVLLRDEDILAFDTGASAWSMYFDGSDVGLGGTDVDAFTFTPDGAILMSLDSPAHSVPGLGPVDDADVIKFIPTRLGTVTAGTFEMWLDGSDVGLEMDPEDVDAIWLQPDGQLLISTIGNFAVTGSSGRDEDILQFEALTWGWESNGAWSLYFDGSDVGLTTTPEDVGGIWVEGSTGDVYLSVAGPFVIPESSGDGLDIFACRPVSLGANTSCIYQPGLYWDGASSGLTTGALDGFFIARQP